MVGTAALARGVCSFVLLLAVGEFSVRIPSDGPDGDSRRLCGVVSPTDGATDDSFDDDLGATVRRVCRVTAYCDRGITAAGVPSGVGQCAAPADIPLGSIVYIPALKKSFIVTDRTHQRFRHNTVDIFMPAKSRCISFGRKYLECEFTICVNPPPYGSRAFAAIPRQYD